MALASILALKPSILLLDEPTAGLDPASRRALLEQLTVLRQSDMTLMLSSHQMEDLALMTSSLTVLDHGEVVLSGPTGDVFAQRERLWDAGSGCPGDRPGHGRFTGSRCWYAHIHRHTAAVGGLVGGSAMSRPAFQQSSFGTVWDTGSFIHQLGRPYASLDGIGAGHHDDGCAAWLGLVVGITITIGYLLMSRIPLKHILKRWLRAMPVVLILAVLQVLFGEGDATDTWVAWFWVRISPASVMSGFRLVLRFSGLLLATELALHVPFHHDMVRAIERLLKPLNQVGIHTQDLVLGIQVALTFIPLLMREVERITKAQASRGAEWGTTRGGLLKRARQALPILIPLFITTLQRAENLAQAIVARGYGGERTSRITLMMDERDALMLLLALAAGVGIVVLGFANR